MQAFDGDGYVRLDKHRMQQFRLEQGTSISEIARLTGMSRNTVGRFFRGEKIQIQSARRMFDEFGCDYRSFLRTVAKTEDGVDDEDLLQEWQIETAVTEPRELSNGLEFRIFKLRHSLLPVTWGRGKCYDLREVRNRDQETMQTQLLRHSVVCRTVSPHPQFVRNERVLYSSDSLRFWVIDEWVDGLSLDEKLRYGALPPTQLRQTMHQILDGLEALHENGIVRRELCPQYLTVSEPNGDILFTELELAKLLDGVISVSNSWEHDRYRAPEVEAGDVSPTVDLYSWAQVFLHAAKGIVPSYPPESQPLESTDLPVSVQAVVERCLSPSYRRRPTSVAEVRRSLGDWR